MYWILKLSLWDNKVTDYKSALSGASELLKTDNIDSPDSASLWLVTNTKHLITCRQLVLLNIVYQTKHKVTILIQPEIIHIWGMHWILKLSLWDRMKSRITNPRHRVY